MALKCRSKMAALCCRAGMRLCNCAGSPAGGDAEKRVAGLVVPILRQKTVWRATQAALSGICRYDSTIWCPAVGEIAVFRSVGENRIVPIWPGKPLPEDRFRCIDLKSIFCG